MKARRLVEAPVVSPAFYLDPLAPAPVIGKPKRETGLWIGDRYCPVDVERLPEGSFGVRPLAKATRFTPGRTAASAPPVGSVVRSGDFVPAPPVQRSDKAALRAAGPISNTGLTGSLGVGEGEAPFAVSIDYLTLVFPDDGAKDQGQITKTIISYLFGTRKLIASELRAKAWQFYTLSAFIRDEDGNTVGRIGRGGNGDTWCVSLSGAGCRLVEDWQRVVSRANDLRAHISRIDVAFDDYRGLVFDIHTVNAMARDGLFAGNGAPPSTRFIDDHGSNKGCTVYVGGKGRKELCIYEKGKQLGDPESPWVRVELRLWARNCVVPMDAITMPETFLRGAYKVLDERLPVVESAESARPEYTRREVDATAEGVKRFLKQQCGPSLQLLWSALGPNAVEWFKENVFRETLPARFRGKGGDRESLLTLLREELGYAFEAPF